MFCTLNLVSEPASCGTQPKVAKGDLQSECFLKFCALGASSTDPNSGLELDVCFALIQSRLTLTPHYLTGETSD